MNTIENPQQQPKKASIPRRTIPIFWAVGLLLVHNVIPWGISLLSTRYGWAEARPGIWNLLGVLSTYQRHGIGRHLVRVVASRLLQQGIQSMRVSVLTINPNLYFYERLGAQYVCERPHDWNGVLLTEAIYGRPDITCLLTT